MALRATPAQAQRGKLPRTALSGFGGLCVNQRKTFFGIADADRKIADAGKLIVARKLPAPPGPNRFEKWLRRKPRPIREASYCVLSEVKEARAAPRHQQRLRYAAIADMKQKIIGECVIQDVSLTGARLKMAPKLAAPAKFHLVEGDCVTLVSIAWRNGGTCGVRKIACVR